MSSSSFFGLGGAEGGEGHNSFSTLLCFFEGFRVVDHGVLCKDNCTFSPAVNPRGEPVQQNLWTNLLSRMIVLLLVRFAVMFYFPSIKHIGEILIESSPFKSGVRGHFI